MDSTTPAQSDLLLRQVTSKLEVTLKIETKPPNALICTLCNNLFTNPIMMGCCGSSFCAECVLTTLQTSQDYVCPGDGCNQIVGCVESVTNFKLHGIVTYWLERSGSEEYRAQTQNTTRNKLAPVENCPPPSVKCPICADLMTNAITMDCCGTNFCKECIARKLSCSNDTSCPGVGCTCNEITRASCSINYQLQNVARKWFDRLERLENAKNLVPTTPSGQTAIIDEQSNMSSSTETDSSSQRCSSYKMTRSAKKLTNTFSPYNRNNSNKKSEQGRENGKQKQVSRNLRSAFSSKQSSENTSDDQNAIVLD